MPINQGALNTAYNNYLGRDVGQAGSDFYMNSGKTMEQIRADLAYSPEGQGYSRQQALPQVGLSGSEQALTQGLGGATDAIMQGAMQGRQDIQQGLGQAQQSIGQGVGALNPFAQTGQSAQALQGALSGAQGPEAQAQAFANYQASPEQAFMREQGERSILGNQAAIGGLGGGNVRKELTRYGTGVAAQDYGNAFNRLGQLSGQGLQAAGQQSNLYGQQAGLQTQAGQNLGSIAQGAGQNIGSAVLGTGQNLAAGRTRAGEQIAGNVQGTTSALSDLINQQGAGLSDITGGGAANQANIINQLAQQTGMSQEQLAALLGNISIGQSGQVAGLPSSSQLLNNQGILGGIGQAASGVGGLLTGLNT